MDHWMFLDEFDLLANIPNNFYDLVNSKKWSERRDALQSVIDLCEKNPRLKHEGNYREILSKFLDILKTDSNVICVAFAIRCITALIKGLRRYFTTFANMVARFLLEKFKETKQAVRNALTESVDALFYCCGLNAVQTPILEVLQNNTNPGVIANTELWIYRILLCCITEKEALAFIESIASFVIQYSSKGDAVVRDASYMIFAGVLRLLGEKTTTEIFDNAFADNVKKKKVKEFYEKAVAEAAELEKQRGKQTIQSESLEKLGCNSAVEINEDVNGGTSAVEDYDIWDSSDAVDISGKLPENFTSLIESKQWKERREALEALLCLLEKNQRLKPNGDHTKLIDLLIEVLEKDVNINVAILAAKALVLFTEGLRYDFAPYASSALKSVFQKFKEKKNSLRIPLCNLIDSIGRYAPLSNYVGSVEAALESGNPQVRAQTALFLSRLWKEYDGSCLPLSILKEMAPLLLQRTFDPDPECREASYAAIGAAMKSIGEEGVKMLFSEVMLDELKMVKVKEKCEQFQKECGIKASAQILRLCKTFGTQKMSNEIVANKAVKSVIIKGNKKRVPLALIVEKKVRPAKASHVATGQAVKQVSAAVTNQSFPELKCGRTHVYKQQKCLSTTKGKNSIEVNEMILSKKPQKKLPISSQRNFSNPLTAFNCSEVPVLNEVLNSNNKTMQTKLIIQNKIASRPRSQPSLTAKYSSLKSGRSRIPLPSSWR